MMNRSKNRRSVCATNRKLLLVAVCLTVIPCAVAGIGAEQVQSGPAALWQTVRMKVTGYCPCPKCCGKYSDGKTAGGHEITEDDAFVAADKKFSFGAKIIVPGYNDSQPVEVLDRGGAIRGNRLDVFFNSHREARQWGVRYLWVRVQAG